MNVIMIANRINRNFKTKAMLCGVLRILSSSGRAMQFDEYIIERKDGEVDGTKIAGQF